MSNQEINDAVDKRLFDEDGNIREDIAESKESELSEEITVDSLNAKFEAAMSQVDATFTQVAQEFGQLTEQMRSTMTDLHVRVGVIEELLTNIDLNSSVADAIDGKLDIEDLKEIAESIVIPNMKIRAEEVQAEMKRRYGRMEELVNSGSTPEEAIDTIEKEDKDRLDNPSGLKIVSS